MSETFYGSSVTLGDFMRQLQSSEASRGENQLVELIDSWNDDEKAYIENLFEKFTREIISSKPMGIDRGDSNQRLGNLYHKYFVEKFNEFNLNTEITLTTLKKSGYPDCMLNVVSKNENKAYCLELKATSNWNRKDSNRRVLLSSTKKLINQVKENRYTNIPLHMIVTLIYDKSSFLINSIRCDFIDPNFKINFRYEASTSHKQLSETDHQFAIFS